MTHDVSVLCEILSLDFSPTLDETQTRCTPHQLHISRINTSLLSRVAHSFPHHPHHRRPSPCTTPDPGMKTAGRHRPTPWVPSAHRLSVDSQQMQIWTRMDAKNCNNNANHPETDQNISQDNCKCGEPTPPRTSPLPLSSRNVGLHKMLKPLKDRSTIEPGQKTIHHDGEDLAASRVEVRVPNHFREGAATSSFFYNVFRVLSCTIPHL